MSTAARRGTKVGLNLRHAALVAALAQVGRVLGVEQLRRAPPPRDKLGPLVLGHAGRFHVDALGRLERRVGEQLRTVQLKEEYILNYI